MKIHNIKKKIYVRGTLRKKKIHFDMTPFK